MKLELTQERLKDLLTLDPVSCRFTWRVQRQCVRPGTEAGTVDRRGYRTICVDGKKYQEHRLVWLYVHGSWPSGHLDHINGLKADNRPENLRQVSHQENMQNQPHARKTNRCGFAGVRPHGARFQADLRIHGVRRTLGTFDTAEQAYGACQEAKRSAGIPVTGYQGAQK